MSFYFSPWKFLFIFQLSFRVVVEVIMIERFICICTLLGCATGDWVKLPQITNTPKVINNVKTVASLADLSSLVHSDVMSSVFSYDAPKFSSTKATSLVTRTPQTKVTKFLPSTPSSTVTSETVSVKEGIADRIDYEVMDPVELIESEPRKVIFINHTFPARSEQRKVIFMNQTVPMKVLPLSGESGKKFHEENEDDDGVTILDEDDNLNSSEEPLSVEEEYYEYDEQSTTTTKAPRKVTKKSPPKPQRRILQAQTMKAKVHNHLSFAGFMKFLKNIQASFATKTAKTIGDKIKMLSSFRDNLLVKSF